MKNFLLGLSKFVLGIILAMLIMTLAGAAMVKYFVSLSNEPPERPLYDNDLPEDRAAANLPKAEDEIEPAEDAVAEPDLEPEPEPEPERITPEGSYAAYVTQPVGLILRDGPGTDYANIGGIGYQESITVLSEESGWLKVQLSNGEEGWVKDGNTAPE